MAVPVYVAPTKAVTIRGAAEPFVVRGLDYSDISWLLEQHLPSIVQAVEHYRTSLTDVYTSSSMDAFLDSMRAAFPDVAAQVIALAADDADAVQQVKNYPVGAQTALLVAISELTLKDMDGLADPSPALASLLRGATGRIMSALKSPSPASTGLSDDR